MPYTSMQAALATAAIQGSTPTQFSLSWKDYAAFCSGSHPSVSSWGHPPKRTFAAVPVVCATAQKSNSVLHVIAAGGNATSPIPV